MGFIDALQKQNMLTSPIGPSAGSLPGLGLDRGAVAPASSIGSIISQLEPFINRIRNRDLDDLRIQQSILGDNNSIRDPRTRGVMNPEAQNVIYQPTMTDFQKASLGLEREKMNSGNAIDKEKLALAKTTGDEKLALQKGALELNELKNDQIYETKIKDMERKAEEANARLLLSQQQLAGRENNAAAMMEYRQAQLDAQTAKHDLDIARKDEEIGIHRNESDARIKLLQKQLEDAGVTIQETEIDPTGTKKTVTTKKGGSANSGRVAVIGPDNQKGTVTAEEAKKLPKGWSVRK